MLNKRESYFTLQENKKLHILFLILFSAVTISLGYVYRFYFWPFLFALIFYIAMKPVYDLITSYIKRRLISSTLVILLMFVLIIVPVFFLMVSLAEQAYDFYLFAQQQVNSGTMDKFLRESAVARQIYSLLNIGEAEVINKVVDVLKKTSFSIFSNLTDVLTFSLKFSVNFFFMLLILFFLFKDGHRLEEPFYRILPFPDDIEKDVVARLKQVIKVLLAGNFVIMCLQGFMVGLGFYIFGVGMPLLWGSIAAVLSLIPVIGTAFIWLPAVIYLSATGNYIYALILGLWCLISYLILENLAKPSIFGKKLNFHPLIFFFLLLGSIQTFGIAGVILGPVLLTLFFSLWEIYSLLSKYKSRDEAIVEA